VQQGQRLKFALTETKLWEGAGGEMIERSVPLPVLLNLIPYSFQELEVSQQHLASPLRREANSLIVAFIDLIVASQALKNILARKVVGAQQVKETKPSFRGIALEPGCQPCFISRRFWFAVLIKLIG
jgi:hypothetical protein